MTSHPPDAAENKPPALSSTEIDGLLSKTLIANLATIDEDGGIHLLPMWFLPTSAFRPHTIHISTGTCGRGPALL